MRLLSARRSIALFSATVVLALVFFTLAVSGTRQVNAGVPPQGSGTDRPSKITAELRQEFATSQQGSIRYLVVMAKQANVDNNIRDWNAKGRYVLDTLRRVATDTQPPVLDEIKQQHRVGNVASFKPYYIINAIQVSGNLASAEALASLRAVSVVDAFPVVTVDPSMRDHATDPSGAIEWNVAAVRAPEAWSLGFRGTGITIGSLDTGARYTHEALVRQYRGNLGGGNFDHNYNWWPAVGSSPFPVDDRGHGTHTIGIFAGEDADQTNQIGVAPDVKWIATNGFATGYTDPDIIEAGQWLLAPWDLSGQNPDPARRPHIASNSWGGPSGTYDCSTATFFHHIVQSWTAAGIFSSFSAGNLGIDGNGYPASYPETYETGSIDRNRYISTFSSRGPSCFDGSLFPQTVAGGSYVRSAYLPGDDTYGYGWGTSFAQPATAGVAALVLQANPNLTIPEVWNVLTSTARFEPHWGTRPNNTYGWGLIRADDAVRLALQMGGTPTPTITGTPPTPTTQPTATLTATPTCTPDVPFVFTGSLSGDDPIKESVLGAYSECGIITLCPGEYGAGYHYDVHPLINSSGSPVCVTILLSDELGFYSELYSGPIDPNSACTNYVADSNQIGSYLVTIPADTIYNLVVLEYAAGTGYPDYIVTVIGLPGDCPTPIPTTTALPTSPTPTPCTLVFSDVPAGHTFYDEIRCLVCRGIISGYDDGTFRPGSDVTRGQIAKIVANAAGFNEPVSGQTFSDVPPTHTFYEFIERLAAREMIGGYSDGTFRPGNPATRAQIAKIVANAAGFNEPVSGQRFSDVPSTHTFYEFIERMAQRGIIGGYADGTYRPGNNATRGQVSKIVANTFYPECNTP